MLLIIFKGGDGKSLKVFGAFMTLTVVGLSPEYYILFSKPVRLYTLNNYIIYIYLYFKKNVFKMMHATIWEVAQWIKYWHL